MEAIKTRRSVRRVTEKQPPMQLIIQLLEAATRAPNHFNTAPWRFTVLTGEGRDRLGKVLGKLNQQKLPGASDDVLQDALEKGLAKARRAPVVIVVTAEPAQAPQVKLVEEIAAVACAVENMLLAAHALGLGAIWRTGDPAYAEEMKRTFGKTEHSLVIGFIYIGYPDPDQKISSKPGKAMEEITEWIQE